MVKRSIEQDIRNKNFWARSGNFEKNVVVKNKGTKQRVQRILGDCWQWESDRQCTNGDNGSFRHDINMWKSDTVEHVSEFSCSRMSEKHREPEVPEEEVPVVECLDGLARITSKELANNSFCERWHPPECFLYKTKSGCRFGEKCSYALDEQPTKKRKKNDDKSAVAMLKKGNWQEREPVANYGHDRSGQPGKKRDHEVERGSIGRRSSNARQLGNVFQDMKPPKSILLKSTNMQRPIQRVKFTKAIARHTKIRDQNPSLGYICPGEPHERSPKAPKIEDRRGSRPKVYQN